MDRIRYALIIMVLMAVYSIHAATLRVSLDGLQPYTSIQTAIDASAYGDTVLVYPGRYYENVRFNGKNIILGSLEMITGNREYIYSTIIDAYFSGPGIHVNDNESKITIRGFSVVNGTGYYYAEYDWTSGGGIRIGWMSGPRSASIINCHVTGNSAKSGAGLYLGSVQAYLSGVSIHHNWGESGAGIYFAGGSQYYSRFDRRNRCSIYSNYAAAGSDLFNNGANAVHVIVDTFSVSNPWNFYATNIPNFSGVVNPFTFDILNTVHQEVNHDLYVAPWGDDDNSGLSPAEPMRSIFMGMYRIASDSENPKTVHVANGHYSPSLNGQLFPVPVKSHTRLIGESRDGVVLDVNAYHPAVQISPGSVDCLVSALSMTNSSYGVFAQLVNGLSVDNVRVCNSSNYLGASGISGSRLSGITHIRDVKIDNLQATSSARGVYIYEQTGLLKLENIDISNLVADDVKALGAYARGECEIVIDGCNVYNNTALSYDNFTERAILTINASSDYTPRLRVDIKNSAFYDNYMSRQFNKPTAKSINDTLFISNCTFADNSLGAGTITVVGTSVLTNNIFHNPEMTSQIYIPSTSSSGASHTTFVHNNILGGLSGVYNTSSANPLIWGPDNTNYDPLFSYEGNRPYTLSSLSPLIDTGWQYASGMSEPGFDAGGNERLWDGDGDGIAVIDLGAYEYQPIFSPQNLSAELWQNQVLLSWEMPIADRGLSGYRVFRDHLPYADVSGAGTTYFREHISQADTLVYQVAALYGNVESARSDSVVVIVFTTDNADDLAPALTRLSIGPNPFNDIAVIRYTLPKASKVELKIYNLRGQLVRNLESGTKSSGEYILAWEGCDANARSLASGIYFLQLQVDGVTRDKQKVILMK